MATKKPTARPSKKKGSKAFNMRIPWSVWERLDAVATERGISVAALLLNTTIEKIGPG